MRKGGLGKAFIGLMLGVGLGLSILALKSFIADQAIQLLAEEVSASCKCELVHDGVSVSFIPLRVEAKRPRIVSAGATALEFARVRADFSLSQIAEHKILMTELLLSNGIAYGVGPDSPTFLFIDQITKPIAPERDRPDRWRLVMLSLQVVHSRFIEPFATSSLTGEEVSLEVTRDDKDNFQLIPHIERLRVVKNPARGPQQAAIVELGRLRSYLYLDGITARYQGLRLAISQSLISGEALSKNKEDNALSGTLNYSVFPQDYDLPEWLRANFQGTAAFSGSLGRPTINGSFGLAPGTNFDLFGTIDKPIASFPQLSSELDISIRRGQYSVALPNLSATGPGLRLSTKQNITSNSGILSGRLSVEAQELVFEDGTFQNVTGDLIFFNTDTEPEVTFVGKSARVFTHAFEFASVGIKVETQDDKITLEFSHAGETTGKLEAKGQISLLANGPSVDGLSFTADKFALFQRSGAPHPYFETLRFSGSGQLGGPLDLSKIAGSANWWASSTQSILPVLARGTAKLERGTMHLAFQDEGKATSSELSLALLPGQTSSLSLVSQELRFEDYFPDLSCVKANGQLKYEFPLTAPLNGDGTLDVRGFTFGCAEYAVALEQAAKLSIAQGAISLAPLSFRGENTSMLLQGDLRLAGDVKLNAQGHLELSSLMALVPSMDDIRGRVDASLDIRGTLSRPLLRGKASVAQGEFAIESVGLSATDLRGDVRLENEVIEVQTLTGLLNGGTVALSGTLYPLSLERSSLQLRGSGISIEPFERASAQLGGQLSLQALPTGKAGITGTIEVEAGEFSRSLDLPALLRDFSNSIFSAPVRSSFAAKAPGLELDLVVNASRNLFLYTDWAGAELKGKLQIVGPVANPNINGEVTTLSGWFGVRDRRFEISSGALTFKAGQGAPVLELIGETYVPARTGETVLVIAEARGPLFSPRIVLSSDSGLSQREILNLLASGGNLGGQTQVNAVARAFELDQEALFSDPSRMTVAKFLADLTKLNTITLQPTYNVQTGLIEPFVVAEKRITDALSLVGESSLGGTVTESRLKLLYDLGPALKIAGILESVSSRQKTAFGTDLTYTILAKQLQTLEVELSGNNKFDRNWILRRLRLNEHSRIPVAEIQRVKLALLEILKGEGYFNASAEVICNGPYTVCEHIYIQISEGEPTYISSVEHSGDSLQALLGDSFATSLSKDQLATESFRSEAELGITRRLRSEGYIEARVRASYEPGSLPGSRILRLDTRAGKPVSFSFDGNTRFSAREFLDTINLFERRLPFGNNTINILLQNIERLYRQAGYLYVTINAEKINDPSGRVQHKISIDEGPEVHVESVTFSGLQGLSTDTIRERLLAQDLESVERLFNPHYAIAEDLEINVETIKALLREEGYPNVEVFYDIKQIEELDQVALHYTVKEGTDMRADWFTVVGMPPEINLPSPPQAPYSIPKANRYIDVILNLLREHGYLHATLWTDLDIASKKLTVHIEPSAQTHIDAIEVQGNLNIKLSTILNELNISKGAAWDVSRFQAARLRLFKLGLFSRIEMLAADGQLDEEQETLLVRLTEKPLRTLEVGTGLNSEFGLHLFGEGIDRRFFSDGRALSVRIDTYYDSAEAEISQGVAGLRYFDPEVFNSSFSLAEDLRYQKIDLSTQEFDLDRLSLASYLSNSSFDDISMSIGHTALSEDLSNVSPGAIIGEQDTGHVFLSFLSGIFTYDKRDNPLNPRKGYNLNFDYKIATEALGSDSNFYAFGAKFAAILPADDLYLPRLSLAFNSRTAGAWTFNDSSQIPITQRYYLGGRNSIRGFRENSLGPRGADGSVIGGDILFSSNTELRYLLLDSLSVHAFLDIGSVFLREESASLSDLRLSTGLGFRFISPIGPIGMDVGAPLDEASGEPSMRVHFSIGSNF